MKKSLYKLLYYSICSIVSILTFSYCTADQNVEVEHYTDTEFTVDLQNVVSPFTYQLYRNELDHLPNSSKIELSLLIYQKSTGKLVAESSKEFTSYKNIGTFNLKVPTVDLQAIVISRVVTDDGESDWNIESKDKITTLRIKQKQNSLSFGTFQILGIGSMKINPSNIINIPIKPAGGLLIPRITVSKYMATHFNKVKYTLDEDLGEFVFDKEGGYKYTNLSSSSKDEMSCVIEFDPLEFYNEGVSYNTLYTYKFIPAGLQLNLKEECFSIDDKNIMTDSYNLSKFEVKPGVEIVLRKEIFYNGGGIFISGDASGKVYQDLKDSDKTGLFGRYHNPPNENDMLSTNDKYIGRIDNRFVIDH